MNNVETIRDFNGRVIGKVETDKNGNRTVRDFYGRVLGKYFKKSNLTKDFYGRIVARGDSCMLLLNRTSR